jgi:hypothetical protein
MKVNELRIGNWIADRGLKEWQIGHWETINKVASKANATMCNGILMETHPLTEYIDYLKPIPITEEWLLKFGFKKQKNNWKRLPICNDWTYLYWERLAGLELSVNKRSVMLPNINYVHQLQNLYYALTGEELKHDTTN